MTLRVMTFLLLFSAIGAMAQTKTPELAKAFVVGSSYVAIDGVWEPDNPTKHNELVFAEVRVECHSAGGRDIVGTEPFCLEVTATPGFVTISLQTTWLKVIEWSKMQIIAVDDSPICLTSQTIIDLTSKTAMSLDIRKPNAKGLMDSCKLLPDRQTYYLRDDVDYAKARIK